MPSHDIVNNAVTRIRTWVTAATTQGTNHYTITALGQLQDLATTLATLFKASYWKGGNVALGPTYWHSHSLQSSFGFPSLTHPLALIQGRGRAGKCIYLLPALADIHTSTQLCSK